MKTKIEKLILAFITLLVVLTSGCKKDDGEELSRTEMLARNWNIISINGQTVSNQSGLDAITLNVKKDGKLVLTGRYGSQTVTFSYTWNWEDNENTIILSDGYEDMEWSVLKLTADDFWFEDTYDRSRYICEVM